MIPRAGDALDELAKLLGTTRRELVAAIVRASHRDWLRALKRELQKQHELDQDDPWDPEE
jgi:hypothetical protein